MVHNRHVWNRNSRRVDRSPFRQLRKSKLAFDFELWLSAPKVNNVRGQKKIFSILKGGHQNTPTSGTVHCMRKAEARRLLSRIALASKTQRGLRRRAGSKMGLQAQDCWQGWSGSVPRCSPVRRGPLPRTRLWGSQSDWLATFTSAFMFPASSKGCRSSQSKLWASDEW